MRPRLLLPLALLAVAALLVLFLRPEPPRGHHHPPTATAPMPRMGEPEPVDDLAPGWVEDVMPMHRAVRLASRRFPGKVLDIALIAQPRRDSPLVYRIRILTPGRDVLDIRMDAFTGRFLELRGADLSAARRPLKDD